MLQCILFFLSSLDDMEESLSRGFYPLAYNLIISHTQIMSRLIFDKANSILVTELTLYPPTTKGVEI
jgi:hypothetical protein